MGARKFETWADYLEDNGRQQGMLQAVKSILVNRFGAIPPAALTILDQATNDELGQWLLPAIDTPSIEALFELPAAG